MRAVPLRARNSSNLRNTPNKVLATDNPAIRKGSLVGIRRGSLVDIRRANRLPAIPLATNPRRASHSNRTRNRAAIPPRPASPHPYPVSRRLRPASPHPPPVNLHRVAFLASHSRFPGSRPRPRQVVAVGREARPRSSIRTLLRPRRSRSRHSPTARLRACRKKAQWWRPTSSRARLSSTK